VTANAAIAAAAAAAEAAGNNQQQQQQDEAAQRYISVTPHHIAVLEMLLVPAVDDTVTAPGFGKRPKTKLLQYAMHTAAEFFMLINTDGSVSRSGNQRFGTTTELPRIPADWCLPLHLLLCEAVALAPELPSLHMTLIFMMALLDIYSQVRILV
jgi:hypothetical protein